ncbi:MAG TPA: DUF1778 domain-containing protein [Burkholderiales bacterium]|nr:DUF1778 domain-containing protein [Burkholderiales bacterium]
MSVAKSDSVRATLAAATVLTLCIQPATLGAGLLVVLRMASDAVSNRDTAINLRARASDRDLIDRAAQAQGKTRSEFMLEAARERARQVLVDQVFFQLDAKAFKRFEKLLEAPVGASSKRLIDLLQRKAPWEK